MYAWPVLTTEHDVPRQIRRPSTDCTDPPAIEPLIQTANLDIVVLPLNESQGGHQRRASIAPQHRRDSASRPAVHLRGRHCHTRRSSVGSRRSTAWQVSSTATTCVQTLPAPCGIPAAAWLAMHIELIPREIRPPVFGTPGATSSPTDRSRWPRACRWRVT